MCRENEGEPASADSNSLLEEAVADTLDGAAHPLLRGLFASAECFGHFTRRAAMKVAQEQGIAIAFGQLSQGIIEMGRDLFPNSVRFSGMQFIHGHSFLFTSTTADIGTDGFDRKILRSAMEPTGKNRAIGEPSSLPSERNENRLCDILREMRVAHHPEHGRINDVNVAANQFCKCIFRTFLAVAGEELLVGKIDHS